MKSEQIIQLRAGLGLSRAEFARVFGVTEKTTFNWEIGIIPRGRTFELLQCFLNVKKGSQLWGRMIEMIHAGQSDALAQLAISSTIGTGQVLDGDPVAATMGDESLVLTAISQSAFIGIEISRPQLQSIFTHLHELSDGIHRTELQIQVKQFMDQVPGKLAPGGFAHRVLHGHSLADGMLVFKDKGIEGLAAWTLEESYDVCSPHGLPLPWANEVWKGSGLTAHQALKWLSFNATDIVVAGAVALGMMNTGGESPSAVALSATSQLALGFVSANPLLIVMGGIALTGALAGFLQGQEITKVNLSMRGFRAFSSDMQSWKAFTPDFDFNNHRSM
jgi:DNA-binding XRE family transcriptional regulator